MTKPPETISPVRRLRLERGLSLERLAFTSGLSISTVWRAENRPGRLLRAKTVRKLAETLECQPRELLPALYEEPTE